MINRRISIAPMMGYTDRHFRRLARLLSRHVLLYTEMVTTGQLMHGDVSRALRYNSEEHPVALQLGGSDPHALSHCARLGEDFGYDEINLNVGCPSDRVQSGQFGACLMKQPELVAECIDAMQHAVGIPVTIKMRIGVDDLDTDENLTDFVKQTAGAGCQVFIIHARKAWLKGLSPKENREVPPLRYDTVYRLKQNFPDLEIIINGGVKTRSDIEAHLLHVDGVMIGREACANPMLITEFDRVIVPDSDFPVVAPEQVLAHYLPYATKEVDCGEKLRHLMRHLSGLYHGKPGAKRWRRHIGEVMEGSKVDLRERAFSVSVDL